MNTSNEVIAAVRQMTEAKLREVHEATGVPMPTLAKIRYGVTADPRGSTLDIGGDARPAFARAQP